MKKNTHKKYENLPEVKKKKEEEKKKEELKQRTAAAKEFAKKLE